jgi:hypothetical protein
MTPLDEKLKEITDPAFFMDRTQEQVIAAIKQSFREIVPEAVTGGWEEEYYFWNELRSEILKQLE